jgi:hypothetical protein
MSSIASFRTSILKILDDAGLARFTNDQVDQGLRAAMAEYSRSRPDRVTRNFDGTGKSVLEMPADFQALQVIQVELHNDTGTPQCSLPYYAYIQDSSWFLYFMDYVPLGSETIDVTYTAIHTVDGLDGAACTSIPAQDEVSLQMGAAGYATLYRAVGRSESVNLQPAVSKGLVELSGSFLRVFQASIYKTPGSAFAHPVFTEPNY